MKLTSLHIPTPHVTPELYLRVRQWLLEYDPDARTMLEWSESTAPPSTPEEMAGEIIWVILCAGRSAQAARTLMAKVRAAIETGIPVVTVFGYRAKAAAIDRAWRERDRDFAALQDVLRTGDVLRLLTWAKAIPFIGDDTQYQLLKNFGIPCPKPDRWLARLAGIPDKPRRPLEYRINACMALCRLLADASGDCIASVDSLLWLACNKGILVTDSSAAPVQFVERISAVRSIYLSHQPDLHSAKEKNQ
ncbi:hypothetical protein [Burkholderia cepacia]|uniref:hypothetical protein n=1 Tax=Burkholderia cepacia TaxID=292 RepID=UPI002AB6FEA3|nr:hypothetical protein [Burkholderia cepacia]